MKAPDKIYLVKDAANPEGIFDTVASKKPMFYDDECYIRKDALLEIIKEESKFWDDGEMIFRSLVDKIKSM